MANRISNRRRLKKYSIGDMREWILIHRRAITAPSYDSVSITETYDSGTGIWASCETLDKKRAMFSGVNIPEGATDSFIIRYDPSDEGFPLNIPIEFSGDGNNPTSEYIISWKANYYDILKTSNPDGRGQYLELFSRLKGNANLMANT